MRCKEILEKIDEGVLVLDGENVVFYNAAFASLSDSPANIPKEVVKWNFKGELFVNAVKKALSSGQPFSWQAEKGTRYNVSASILSSQEVCCIFRQEDAHYVQVSEDNLAYLETMEEKSPVNVTIVGYDAKKKDTLFLYATKRAKEVCEKFWGVSPNELPIYGKSRFKPENIDSYIKYYKHILEHGGVVERETEMTAKDGDKRIFRSRISYFGMSKEHQIPLFVSVNEDVTAYTEMQENMRKNEETARILQQVFDQSPLAMAVMDGIDNWHDYSYKLCNKAHEHFVGEKNLTGTRARELSKLKPQRVEWFLNKCRAVAEKGEEDCYEVSYTVLGAGRRTIWVTLFPVGDRLAYICQDITRQKEMEHQLKRYSEDLENLVKERTAELEAALEVKSRFLAIMSHEIRTPMTGITGMISLLAETSLNKEQQELIHVAQVCAEQLLLLINDILDLTKMQENKMTLESSEFSLYTIIRESLEVVMFTAASKGGIELAYELDDSLNIGDVILGDALRLRQILVNLLSNAIKFSSQGVIKVHASVKSQQTEKTEIQISVSDQGCGIPESSRSHIFQPFMQADTSVTRKFGGSGLGLSISKRLAELMGGTMWFESEVGKGSTFYFTFLTEKRGKLDLPQPVHPHKSILAIGSSMESLSAFGKLLRSLGFQNVTTMLLSDYAPSQKERKEGNEPEVQTPQTEKEFEVVFCMGTETEIVEQVSKFFPKSQVVLLGFNKPNDKYPFLKHPVCIESIMNLLDQKVTNPKPQDMNGPSSAQQNNFDINILVAEDNPLNQKVIGKFLSIIGYKNFTVVGNGKEAVELFKKQDFDVILMDIEMPVLSGVQATKIIRTELPAEKQIPIIALTANAFSEDIKRYLSSGFTSVVTKPIQQEQLRKALIEIEKHQKVQLYSHSTTST